MAIANVDSYGPYFDTGANTIVATRASVEVEFHTPSEIDTGSKLAPTQEPNVHIPHRPVDCPR